MYKVTGNLQAGVVEITADTEEDIANLPTHYSAGSTCFVIDDSTVYMLNNQKEQKQI